jgi:hypothetical protein
MPINADKPHLWKQDILQSVDLFNRWFMKFAPKAFRDTRIRVTKQVEEALLLTDDLRGLSPALLQSHPRILPTLRMCTCPPLARDRLIGLSGAGKSLVGTMEAGSIPPRMPSSLLAENLARIVRIISRMLDKDILPWIGGRRPATDVERHRASTIVADRLCGSISDPIIRNAQEKRQLAIMAIYLKRKGYQQQAPPAGQPLVAMQPGTFAFRLNVVVGDTRKVKLPIDVVIQLKVPRKSRLPILVEAKSAGDFTNVNKRRKEEATKMHQLRATYGDGVEFILLLCGYFDSGYLGYEAAEGIDWIWEHRLSDLDLLGI